MLIRPRFLKRLITILLMLAVLALTISSSAFGEEERIIKGVKLGDLELGNMGRQELNAALKILDESLSGYQASLKIGESIIENISYGDLGIKADGDKIWQEAYQIGRKGNWFKRTWTRLLVIRKGHTVSLHLALDKEIFKETIEEKTIPFRKAPQNARFMITSRNEVEILPEVYGVGINMDRAVSDMEKELLKIKPGDLICLTLEHIDIKPSRLKSDLQSFGIAGLIGQFSTNFNSQRVNRTMNIRLAAQALDSVLIAPEEVFSFNKTVGPRTKDRGYDEADIILNNELVPGVGGGVCQVSTTLYNTVLLARLEIVERYPHSQVIPYVQPGLDATVNYGSMDFKFRNNSGSHLLIKSRLYGSSLMIKIFGASRLDQNKIIFKSEKEKEIVPKTIYKEDADVPDGQYILDREGVPGSVIKVERYIYDNKGKLLKRELVSRDYYKPVDRIIKTFSGSALLSNMDNL